MVRNDPQPHPGVPGRDTCYRFLLEIKDTGCDFRADPQEVTPDVSLDRFDSQQCALSLTGHEVKQSVRPLSDVSDSLMQLPQHRFATDLLPLVVELDALQLPGARRFTSRNPPTK